MAYYTDIHTYSYFFRTTEILLDFFHFFALPHSELYILSHKGNVVSSSNKTRRINIIIVLHMPIVEILEINRIVRRIPTIKVRHLIIERADGGLQHRRRRRGGRRIQRRRRHPIRRVFHPHRRVRKEVIRHMPSVRRRQTRILVMRMMMMHHRLSGRVERCRTFAFGCAQLWLEDHLVVVRSTRTCKRIGTTRRRG